MGSDVRTRTCFRALLGAELALQPCLRTLTFCANGRAMLVTARNRQRHTRAAPTLGSCVTRTHDCTALTIAPPSAAQLPAALLRFPVHTSRRHAPPVPALATLPAAAIPDTLFAPSCSRRRSRAAATGAHEACRKAVVQLLPVQILPNEDQLAHALLLWRPRPPRALGAAAELQQHVHALEHVPACARVRCVCGR